MLGGVSVPDSEAVLSLRPGDKASSPQELTLGPVADRRRVPVGSPTAGLTTTTKGVPHEPDHADEAGKVMPWGNFHRPDTDGRTSLPDDVQKAIANMSHAWPDSFHPHDPSHENTPFDLDDGPTNDAQSYPDLGADPSILMTAPRTMRDPILISESVS